jgi:hypothetical protein
MKAPLSQSTTGGSGSFPCLGSDGRRYWVKTLNGPQGSRVPVTEQLIGRAGAIMEAPTCFVEVIFIPKAFVGWEFRPGYQIQRGFAHASLAVENSVEEKALSHRNCDENSVRHAGYFAMYDWCWGDDLQGLLSLDRDNEFHSHDHGHFLPGGPAWDVASLKAHHGDPHPLAMDTSGLSVVELNRVAVKLEAITRGEILAVVSRIPRSWPVTDAELEEVGAFLEHRAPLVAARLRALAGGTP